jgi:hypothetical protein
MSLTSLLGPTGGWKRQTLLLAAGLAVAAGLALADTKPGTLGLQPHSIDIEAQAIASFDKENPNRTRFGKLEWRGGLVLSSPSPNFGGWSGLAFDPDGKTLIAISDAGTWMTARLTYDGGRPKGLTSARLGPLLAHDGKGLFAQRDRDAEAVALAEGSLANGTLLISFEQNDRIGRFAVSERGVSAPAAYLKVPPEIHLLGRDGFEAVTVLRGGPFKGAVVAFGERRLPGDSNHTGWIWVGSEPKPFVLADLGQFDITDTASFADGSLLVLERFFRWNEGLRMRLRLVKANALKPGTLIKSEVLLEADLSREIDNMEGLAVHAGNNGETLITMISDDNFNNLLQRTVLLEFALPGDALISASGRAPATAATGAVAQ